MVNNKIWLSSPHMGGEEIEYIKEAFDSNWVAPLGPNVTGFEQDLEAYLHNKRYVAALSSGTAAIHLGLILLGVVAGDEVICQSMTFSASANPIAYLGATPVFVDSEPDTWNMSPEFLEEAIIARLEYGKKPKAIIPVHLYGMPAKMQQILAVANKYEIPVLEDAAEALGSSINGEFCGTFGDIACLSFNGNKIITTSGGGALVAKANEMAEKAVFLATQARDQAPHYEHTHIGYNYRMSNICAGIGRGQMKVLDKHIELRRSNLEYYRQALSHIKEISFLDEPEGYKSNRWLSCAVIDPSSGISQETIRFELNARNIESRPLWKPMHLQPIFRNAPYYGENTCEELFNKGICLPSGSNLANDDLSKITRVITEIYR
ncbi:DegT/DnrJ/EryC1/StrS family aminotransferase [Daejeonella lutea]|uniref:GDP-perosamine synthase n=1 Tax=Daejeonella lutea TaxID=572036 RepID=A0A1T5FAU1_9SPHI|nr:DegT/DnrJ/EryC1/StrS family aminotransferase [Daejeonella lutea]SKB93246.1 dTDP-4-amino-4,6-dideoxygalactose transaminase [Daejeonella lutea]